MEIAPGVHRIGHAHVNCYLVEGDDGRLLLVDTGLPRAWRAIGTAIRAIGRRPHDLAAVVLTHAHFDHTGSAARAVSRGLPVWVSDADAYLAAHPYRYAHENPRAAYPLRHPAAVPILLAMAAAGALWVRGVDDIRRLPAGEVLDVPGRPHVLPTPGHTAGHVALHLPDRDTLLTGDALVTLDPYTGGRGPQIIAGAATADSAQALRSLDVLEASGATVVLPGHGEPWLGGIGSAVAAARAVGAH